MRHHRPAVLLCLLLVTACGAATKDAILVRTAAGLNAAAAAYTSWDQQHQDSLVLAAVDMPTGAAALAAYRAARKPVTLAFVAAYSALAAASIDGSAESLIKATEAAQALLAALHALGVL